MTLFKCLEIYLFDLTYVQLIVVRNSYSIDNLHLNSGYFIVVALKILVHEECIEIKIYT